jgi:hypothetical protein
MPSKEAAMIELTREQHRAMELRGESPPRVRDPETRITYVLLREDAYGRLKSLLAAEEFDPDEALPALQEAVAEDDADDPLLGSYQTYRKLS